MADRPPDATRAAGRLTAFDPWRCDHRPDGDRRLVAAWDLLPGLSAQLPGLERRRDRGPSRDHEPVRSPERRDGWLARDRRDLALADLPLADGRFRLRRVGLP